MEKDVLEWLLINGGPAIKLRLSDASSEIDIQKEADELFRLSKISQTVEYFNQFQFYTSLSDRELFGLVHNGYENCFEPFIHVLQKLGFKKGIKQLDDKIEIMRPVYRYLMEHSAFYAYIIIKNLLKMGYVFDDMLPFLRDRIHSLHRITLNPVYQIYQKEEELIRRPKWMEGNKVIKDELSPYKDVTPLPLRQDIEMLLYIPSEFVDPEMKKQIDDIMQFVLDIRYQKLKGDYGWLWNDQVRTYHASNEGFRIPLSLEEELIDKEKFFFFSNLEILSKSKLSRQSDYFKKCIMYVQKYDTDQHTYLFPEEFFYEANTKSGYFIEAMLSTEARANLKRKDSRTLSRVLYGTMVIWLVENAPLPE